MRNFVLVNDRILALLVVFYAFFLRIAQQHMKQNSNSVPKFGLRPPEAAFALGSAKILEECIAAGWLRPVIQRHKLTIFDAGDVARCWARLVGGEDPSLKNR